MGEYPHRPALINFVSFLIDFLEVLLVVAVMTKVFKIVEVESDARVLDVLRSQVALVVYDVAGNDEAIGEAPLTKSAHRLDVTVPASLPCC